MKTIIKGLFIVAIFGSLGCDQLLECSGKISSVYTIGKNVTEDFGVSSVAFTATIDSSTCDTLPAATTVDETVEQVVRSGNNLTFTQSAETISTTITGTALDTFSEKQSFTGCEISVVLTGAVVSADNTITTTGDFSAKGLTCNVGI